MSGLVIECVLLRRWILPFLTHRCNAEELIARWPDVSPGAWEFFLAAEVIAAPLSRRLGASSGRLAPEPRAMLERAARSELQRMMAARAQLGIIEQLARECDARPLLLKGAIALVDDSGGFDLGDIDLLLTAGERDRMAAMLVSRGGYVYDEARDAYRTPWGIPVEMHVEFSWGYGADILHHDERAAMPGFEYIHAQSPASHALYMLQHATAVHAQRRGHLRDALVIASALDQATAAERKEVEDAVRASRLRRLYEPMLSLARAMQQRAPGAPPAEDVYEGSAAAKYSMARWQPGAARMILHTVVTHVPFFVAQSWDAPRYFGAYILGRSDASSTWYLPVLHRRSPGLARTVAFVLRTPVRLFTLTTACAIACGIVLKYRIDTYAARRRGVL